MILLRIIRRCRVVIVWRVEAVLSREQAVSGLLAMDEEISVIEKAILGRAFRGEL